ncbi:MAG: alpha-E domain-containing protein [Fimbriimonadaceae bacterium]
MQYLLARVAQNLYWFGRYVERAENCSRQIRVTADFYRELGGLSASAASDEWDFLAQCFPSPEKVRERTKEGNIALDHINHYLTNPKNTVSVAYSVAAARDCARATSETLTREVVVNLNDTHLRLSKMKNRLFRDSGKAYEEVDLANRQILLTLGAIENTLTRDQGWCYQKLGEALERTCRTLIVLGARLPNLKEVSETGSPLHFAGWRSLLAHLASLENYRQKYGPRFTSTDVTDFLVFNAGAPRSVNCGVRRMLGYLNQLPPEGPGIKLALREIGKLSATLTYDREQILEAPKLGDFVGTTLASLNQVHAALTDADQYV